jgi:hypothetical protein
MKNLFPSSFRQSNTGVLKPGSYTVELVAIRPATPKDFGDGSPPRERLTFCFKTAEGAPVNRTLSATNNPRGRLVEFVRQMAGVNQPTSEQVDDGVKFTAYLESLVGNKFQANIVPSRDGRFNNIVSISSCDRGEKEAA